MTNYEELLAGIEVGEGTYANIMLASAATAIRALKPTAAAQDKPTSEGNGTHIAPGPVSAATLP